MIFLIWLPKELVGGGWYGGSAAGYTTQKSRAFRASGGGGSGFVWTSGTVANAPSGYNVNAKYYLADAATYGGGTSFTGTDGSSETGHSGDGYARITVVYATKVVEEEVTAKRWISVEEQKENGTLTGEFYYNGHTITVTDTQKAKQTYPFSNEKPTLEVEVNSVTATKATITAVGTDPDGDNLTYTLTINNETYNSRTGIFNITGLEPETTYTYIVTVKDPYSNTSKEGTLTTTVGNTAPVITSNYDYKSGKSTNKFTIRMQATDLDGGYLTYSLYYSTSEDGNYTKAGTASVAAGTYTDISQTGLKEYTDYWWYITVTDGEETVTSEKQKLRTYCSGSNLTCSSTTYCSKGYTTQQCSICGGSGSCYKADGVLQESTKSVVYSHLDGCSYNYASSISATKYYCDICGAYVIYTTCPDCGVTEYSPSGYDTQLFSIPSTHRCGNCGGDGEEQVITNCPEHNTAGGHYYCTTHNYVGNNSTHKYCSHGKTSKHDS